MFEVGIDWSGQNPHITDYPDAVKFATVPADLANPYAHLWLHIRDLTFAHDCLLRLTATDREDHILMRALWHAALVSTFKCFQHSKARGSLSRDDIYEAGIQREVFDYLKHIRNKTVVHDENDWSQALIGAVINPPDYESSVEAVLCFATEMVVHDDEPTVNNLGLVIETALAWATARFDARADELREHLSSWEYTRLLDLPDVQWTLPTAESVSRKRQTPGA